MKNFKIKKKRQRWKSIFSRQTGFNVCAIRCTIMITNVKSSQKNLNFELQIQFLTEFVPNYIQFFLNNLHK